MRLAFGFAIALWLSFPAAGLASHQQAPAASAKAPAQAPAAPAPKENAPADTPPAQKSPAETVTAKTTPAPAEQVPAVTAPTAPANPPTPTAEKKEPDGEVKQKMDAGSAGEPSTRGTSPSGTSSNGARKRRKRTASAPNGAPRRIVVREGGATEPAEQIVSGMTPVEATRQRQNAEQWLASTGDQLKQLAGRTLDARQQDTVGQIRNYMDGARTALKEGDVRRASTLAQKAHLLAEDLVKH
jgi:ribonuclease E